MKKIACVMAALAAASVLAAQPAQEVQVSEPAEKTELIVFAAASMTETMTEIGKKYEEEHPEIAVRYNFDSSGTLKTQIVQGAPCDLFISASPKQMNALDASKEGGEDIIDQSTRLDLLENKVTLSVPQGNPKNITSFDQMADLLKNGSIFMAIGNSDVPVGQYTQKIFAYYGIDEEAVSSKLTYGSNVKEVTTQVSQGSVDCGIIYATDAFSAGLQVVDTATKEMCGQVIYPAAVLKSSSHPEEAKAFLAYLQTQEAVDVFESVGFSPAF